MATRLAIAGERRDFVAPIAVAIEQLKPRVFDGRGEVRVQQPRWWPSGELGLRLDRQLVPGDVLRRQTNRLLQVGQGGGHGLVGQAVHQIDVEALEAGLGHPTGGVAGLVRAVDAAKARQLLGVERLCAQGDARDARSSISVEVVMLDGAGIRFQRDFRWRRRQRVENRPERARRKEARRAAAEVHRLEMLVAVCFKLAVQVFEQRSAVVVLLQ